jgi:hypothetical protein
VLIVPCARLSQPLFTDGRSGNDRPVLAFPTRAEPYARSHGDKRHGYPPENAHDAQLSKIDAVGQPYSDVRTADRSVPAVSRFQSVTFSLGRM